MRAANVVLVVCAITPAAAFSVTSLQTLQRAASVAAIADGVTDSVTHLRQLPAGTAAALPLQRQREPLCASDAASDVPPLDSAPGRRVALLVEPTPFTHVSGYSNRFKEMLRFLKAGGDDAEVITPDDSADRPADFLGMPITYIPGFRLIFYKQVQLTIDLGLRAFRRLRKTRPNVIHAVTPGFLVIPAILYARLLQIPLVISYHTHLPTYSERYVPEIFGLRYMAVKLGASHLSPHLPISPHISPYLPISPQARCVPSLPLPSILPLPPTVPTSIASRPLSSILPLPPTVPTSIASRPLPSILPLPLTVPTSIASRPLTPPAAEWYLPTCLNFADLTLATSPQLAAQLDALGCKNVDVWRKGVDTDVFSSVFNESNVRTISPDLPHNLPHNLPHDLPTSPHNLPVSRACLPPLNVCMLAACNQSPQVEMRCRMSEDQPTRPLLLYVGRLGREKNIDLIKPGGCMPRAISRNLHAPRNLPPYRPPNLPPISRLPPT